MNFLKSLIGGQIIKGYSMSGNPIQGLGHHKMWKLYKGKKDSSGTEVSIFVIEKKSIKSSIKEEVIKTTKKQVSSLVKIRHPGVLSLIQPLTEDQNTLAFVTQKVQGSLASLLKQKRLHEQYLGSELQMKLNLVPLFQALTFLHQIVKTCHLGISLDSIYITSQNKWKFAGLGYSQQLTGDQIQSLPSDVHFYDYLHLAPEVVKQGKFNKFSDCYSLGILIINFMLIIKKTQHNLMQPTQSKDSYAKNSQQYMWYNQFPCVLQSTAPQQLIQLLSQIFIEQPSYRITISSIQSCKWINDPIVLTVKYLQKIANYQNKQQVDFLKGFAGVLTQFGQQQNKRIFNTRILPVLVNLLKFNHLIPSIIYIVIDVIKNKMIDVQQFRKKVWVEIKPITQGKQMTAHALYLLILNMEILEKFINEEDFMACIIPLYLKCFDCPPKLKVLALKHVERLSKKYDYQFTKTKIIPKLVNVMKDQKIQIRKDSLKVLYSIINRLDPMTIVNVVLAGLQNCRKAGADPFINSITVQIYNKMTNFISGQILATKIIPGIMPYLIDPTIEQQQFSLYKNTLLKMMNKIEQQRKKTWSQNTNGQANNVFGNQKIFSENDFVLEKIQEENKSNSNVNVGQGMFDGKKFDFLAEYQQASTPAIVNNNNVSMNASKIPPSSNPFGDLSNNNFNKPLSSQQSPFINGQNTQSSPTIDLNGFNFTTPVNNPITSSTTSNNSYLQASNTVNNNSNNQNNFNFGINVGNLSNKPSEENKKPVSSSNVNIIQNDDFEFGFFNTNTVNSNTVTNSKSQNTKGFSMTSNLNSNSNISSNFMQKSQSKAFDFGTSSSTSKNTVNQMKFNYEPPKINFQISLQLDKPPYHNNPNSLASKYDEMNFDGIQRDQIKIQRSPIATNSTTKTLKGPNFSETQNKSNKNTVTPSVQIPSYNNKPSNQNYNIPVSKKQPQKIIKNQATFDDDWAMGDQEQARQQDYDFSKKFTQEPQVNAQEFQNYFTDSSSTPEPTYETKQNQNFNFESYKQPTYEKQSNNKKQLPISPSSTQPRVQDFGLSNTMPKKLVGPGQVNNPSSRGGLKKPPKYNQFNMHLNKQASNTFNQNNNAQSSNLGFLGSGQTKPTNQSSVDPFSSLNQSGFNLGGPNNSMNPLLINNSNQANSKNNTSKSNNNDPFSDLW